MSKATKKELEETKALIAMGKPAKPVDNIGDLPRNRAEFYLTEDGKHLLRGWVRSGATNRDVAKAMGVHINTLLKWLKKYPALKDLMTRTKEVVDYEVEAALYKAAVGQNIKILRTNQDGKTYECYEYIPPNVTAQIFWLKNRMPKYWRDKNITEVHGGLPVVIKDDLKE